MFWLVLLCLVFVFTEADQVLLVSMDGFRWDYLKKATTPNFDSLASRGTKAEYINNTFITKTFPCHYSVATGLYEESHGIIGNIMYDPVFNSTFKMSTKQSKWWDGGEPIWVTVRKHNLTSAVYFWPGSETEIRGYRPNHWRRYQENVEFKDRVDQVIEWLSVDNIDFVALYFHEPDATGHWYGPDSSEIIDKVEYMDSILGYIMGKFDSNGLWDKVNFMLTSDHGMTTIDTVNKVVDISEHVDMSKILFTVDTGPIMQVHPKEGQIDNVVNSLKSVSNMTVYKKEDIPNVWHYGKNRRVMPVFLLADEGWTITKNKTALNEHVKGAHGYDNRLDNMKPIFLAAGPNIRINYITPTFRSIDIYPTICKLLNITPSPNNGSLQYTSNFLVTDNDKDTNNSRSVLVNAWLLFTVNLLCGAIHRFI